MALEFSLAGTRGGTQAAGLAGVWGSSWWLGAGQIASAGGSGRFSVRQLDAGRRWKARLGTGWLGWQLCAGRLEVASGSCSAGDGSANGSAGER